MTSHGKCTEVSIKGIGKMNRTCCTPLREQIVRSLQLNLQQEAFWDRAAFYIKYLTVKIEVC